MKIKKILAVMASAFMISAAFSGCSGKEDGNPRLPWIINGAMWQ